MQPHCERREEYTHGGISCTRVTDSRWVPEPRGPDMATVINADDQASFQREVLESTVPVVVDFWAAWCGPCRAVAPEIEALADQYGSAIKVVKVDVDANQAVAGRYGIRGIPTIGLFEGGKLTKQAVGAHPRHAIEAELGLARLATAGKELTV